MGDNKDVNTRTNTSIFGEFKSRSFWADFMRLIVQEAITMFIISLGTTLMHIGRKNKNKDIKSDTGGSDLANKAFGGYTSSGYNGSYNSNTRFPISNRSEEFPGL